MMWKSGQTELAISKPTPEPLRYEQPTTENVTRIRAMPVAMDQATVGRGMVFRGTIAGAGSLVIEGEVVGNINLPESRVTVSPSGHVSDGLSVCINAREIVIMGSVHGNVTASDRLEIRPEGTLTGNVIAARISIADGAYFRGDIDLRRSQIKPMTVLEAEDARAYA